MSKIQGYGLWNWVCGGASVYLTLSYSLSDWQFWAITIGLSFVATFLFNPET